MANIVIMPGGFHPFHAGHAALYNAIKEKYGNSDVYVAASNNQKERPFPFKIKEKLAQISGVQPGEFVQVKSPFVPKEITDKYDPDKDSIVFVRSEKDRNEYPKPGMTKKDGSPAYFQHITDQGLQPLSKVGYMDYLPVKEFAGITSATQIRETWPSLNDEQREEFVTHIYPNIKGNDKLIKNVVKLLSKGMSLNEGLAYIDDKGNRVDYTRPDLPTDIEDLVIDWFNDRDRYTKATLQSKGYKVDVDDKINNIDIVDKKGRKYTVSVDDAMGKLIQQAYQEPINEDKPVAKYNTKQANKMIRRYCQEKEIPIQRILTQGKKPRKNLTVIADRHVLQNWGPEGVPAFTQEDANEIQVMLDAPRVTITGQGNYINVHGVMKGELNDEPLREAFVSPDQSKQYWNHDAQKVGVGGEIEMPLTDKPNLNGRRQGFNEGEERKDIAVAAYEWLLDLATSRPDLDYDELYRALEGVSHDDLGTQKLDYFMGEPLGLNMDNKGSIVNAVLAQMMQTEGRYRYNESIDKIRNMIKETDDDKKSKSVDLHRKLFELFEEEKDNVLNFPDKKSNVIDLDRQREYKSARQGIYTRRREQQENYLKVIQNTLFGLHEEFAELEQLGLMPIAMKDAFEQTKELIQYIEDYNPDDDDFPFDRDDLVEKLQVKTVQLKEYFGGWRDTQAPRVLRQQTPKLTPKAFWNTIDLSETADYIEEK
tara:strand:+ start:1723 stop:3843 length:2121 start_codon:yes stop_codon:yes gene_type:complete